MRQAVIALFFFIACSAHAQGRTRSHVVADLVFEHSPLEALMILSIEKDGVRLGSSLVPASSKLEDLLRANARVQETKRIALFVDGAVLTSRFIEILSQVRSAGIERVTLLTPPVESLPPSKRARPPSAAEGPSLR